VDYLDNDIKFVGGVGEARARLLDKELGIRTLGDMLRHYPFRYIDRTKVYRIAEITDDAPTLLQFRARVTGVAYAGTGRKRRFTAYVSDPTGSPNWSGSKVSNGSKNGSKVGREYLIFGRPSFYRGELSMAHPELETMEQARLAQGRKRHAGHLSLDRETFERTRRQGHVPDHLQHMGAGQRTISPTTVPDRGGEPTVRTVTYVPRVVRPPYNTRPFVVRDRRPSVGRRRRYSTDVVPYRTVRTVPTTLTDYRTVPSVPVRTYVT